MKDFCIIGHSHFRKESADKVTGRARYTNDLSDAGLLYARIVTSPYAHALIKSIDKSQALEMPGVRAIVTGGEYPRQTGTYLKDRYPLAVGKVRYHGEPVAVVVAESELQAKAAALRVKVDYEKIKVVNSPGDALRRDAPLIHERLGEYKRVEEVFPKPGTNIANHVKIRKGSMKAGWNESEVIIEEGFSFNQSDHVAMETRCSIAEVKPDGELIITSSSQAPFDIKNQVSSYFKIPPGKVIVQVPLVGGAYGGKTPVTHEFIACIASMAVQGRRVKLVITREQDLLSMPCHIGLEAKIKIGANRLGKIKAMEITYLFDGGAYADSAVRIVKAAAVDCTGPYRVENVLCDSLCMYTNHPYATAFRGFGHSELTFVVERALDILAKKLNMDPLMLRYKNSIGPGDTTPTRARLNRSNIGNLKECIERLSKHFNWGEGETFQVGENTVRAKGVSCFWKTSSTPTDAGAGAVITFNRDGSLNLTCAAVEIGQGTRTGLAMIVAERFKISYEKVNVGMKLDTHTSPEHWKTAASLTTILVGNAALRAADDVIRQLKDIASIPLRLTPDELEVGGGRVYSISDPGISIELKDIAFGYEYPDGSTVGYQVIGRGSYILKHLTHLDPETGRGKSGAEWAVGAQGVEIEYSLREHTYRVLRAITVIDGGKIINPIAARGQIMGGMAMGLSFSSREEFIYSMEGIVQNPALRTYKTLRYTEHPGYVVDFVETPYLEGPYGARGLGEYGVIGIPGALANCLSKAAGVQLLRLPLIPEEIWKAVKEYGDDSL